MADAGDADRARLRSARALRDLALEYGDRSLEAEARLIADFSARAAALAREIGPIVINEDDDERISLTADGMLHGEVLDEDAGLWLRLGSSADVARYYDPTDVFLDLADAIEDLYPGLDAADDGSEDEPPGWDDANGREGDWEPSAAMSAEPAHVPADPTASPMLGSLESLRQAGVLSDEEFERLRSQLGV